MSAAELAHGVRTMDIIDFTFRVFSHIRIQEKLQRADCEPVEFPGNRYAALAGFRNI